MVVDRWSLFTTKLVYKEYYLLHFLEKSPCNHMTRLTKDLSDKPGQYPHISHSPISRRADTAARVRACARVL